MIVRKDHIRITRVVGESEEGLTLFVPKDEQGTFELSEGDRFLTILFIKSDEGAMTPWLPWEGE